jgi:hypothetical protein
MFAKVESADPFYLAREKFQSTIYAFHTHRPSFNEVVKHTDHVMDMKCVCKK